MLTFQSRMIIRLKAKELDQREMSWACLHVLFSLHQLWCNTLNSTQKRCSISPSHEFVSLVFHFLTFYSFARGNFLTNLSTEQIYVFLMSRLMQLHKWTALCDAPQENVLQKRHGKCAKISQQTHFHKHIKSNPFDCNSNAMRDPKIIIVEHNNST